MEIESVASRTYLRPVVTALLAAIVAVVGLICVPNLKHSELIGFAGHLEEGGFNLSLIYDGSPAANAGLRAGDVITGRNGRGIDAWFEDYRSDPGRFIEQRGDSDGGFIVYEIRRDDSTRQVRIATRSLRVSDVVRVYGVRILVVVLLVTLMVVILRSRTRERPALLISLTFGVASLWLTVGIPDWWEFLSPVISGAPAGAIYLQKSLEIVFLQLTAALLVHVVLVFPASHALLRKYPRLLVVNYAGPLLLLALIGLVSTGGIGGRLAAIHDSRLFVNTVVVLVAVALMLSNYRTLAAPGERARIRGIVFSLVVFLCFHLVLWNIPKLTVGHPLVPDYDWALLPMILIPVTMTMSILNHELFGIRGIIRGRIKLLETLLDREKSMVVSRDRRIMEMTKELGELRCALDGYRRAELVEPTEAPAGSSSRLEHRYPEIAAIRSENLLGVSPKWERLFERVVVAARGDAPVLIVGESGTGKTDLARAVWRLGDRRESVYREISCAQFEHADPSFALGRLFGIGTGHGLPNTPREGRCGLLEECDGGTLLLDDIDRLPMNVQDLLLHPLEGRPFEPGIGAGAIRTVSIKFVLATNRDPEQLVTEGKFRADVLARIGERIDVPPLRDRLEDVPVLVEHFLARACSDLGHEVNVVSPKAMNLLCRYPYSAGNARELQAEIRAAAGRAMLEEDRVLRAGYLSDRLRGQAQPDTQTWRDRSSEGRTAPTERGETTLAVLRRHDFRVKDAEAELGYSHKSKTLSNHLRGICIEALANHGWNPSVAATALAGGDRPGLCAKLQRKMERYARTIAENVAQDTHPKLYKNLPAAYHDALHRTIDHFRDTS